MRDVVRIYINDQLAGVRLSQKGSARGNWIKVVQPVQLLRGYNDILLLSETVGLQSYGAFYEKDGAGFKGHVKLTGFRNGDINLTQSSWTFQIGLKGEFLSIYANDDNESAGCIELSHDDIPSGFSWYKAHVDAPGGTNPVALDLSSIGKGQAWINGHHIGRYWTLIAPKDRCQENCNYRGAYNSNKCVTNCGEPTKAWYHIPRSWLQPLDNLLVIFEETEKSPFDISIKLHYVDTVCARVSKDQFPPLRAWSNLEFGSKTLLDKVTPEMHLQCENGHKISSIEFASYGTPQGSCQKFSIGNCHASNSMDVVSKVCQGRNSYSIGVSNTVFGEDPCRGIIKTLVVEH